MSDTSLTRDVMKALADDPIVHVDEIAAQVHDGNVILRGTVGAPMQRAVAVHATRGVPGVRTVDARLDAGLWALTAAPTPTSKRRCWMR